MIVRGWLRLNIALFGVLLAATPQRAAAQKGAEGEWRAGDLRIEANVTSWGNDCGRRPASATVKRSGEVRIAKDGDHLVLVGERMRRTDRCWSANQAVYRVSTSASPTYWKTVCRTRPDDPKTELGTYVMRMLGPDQLEFSDVSQYDWALNESRCVATIRSTQVLTRPRETPKPSEATEKPAASTAPRPDCRAEDLRSLDLAPNKLELEPGERRCFRVLPRTQKSCKLDNRQVEWRLEKEDPALSLAQGCVHADENAPEAEHTMLARFGTSTANARIIVRHSDLSDLIARQTLGGGGVVGRPHSSSDDALALRIESEGKTAWVRDWRFWLLALGIGFVTALALLFFTRRRALAAPGPEETSTAPPKLTKICPKCGDRFEAHISYCGKDGVELESVE